MNITNEGKWIIHGIVKKMVDELLIFFLLSEFGCYDVKDDIIFQNGEGYELDVSFIMVDMSTPPYREEWVDEIIYYLKQDIYSVAENNYMDVEVICDMVDLENTVWNYVDIEKDYGIFLVKLRIKNVVELIGYENMIGGIYDGIIDGIERL